MTVPNSDDNFSLRYSHLFSFPGFLEFYNIFNLYAKFYKQANIISSSTIANALSCQRVGTASCPQRPKQQGNGFAAEAVGVPRKAAPLVAGHSATIL